MSQNDNQQRSAEQRTVTDRTPREPKLNLNFPPGAQPDIIRANQKDVYYLSVLQEQMSSVCQQLFGSRRQHQWQKAIATFSDFCYYGLTTLLGTQTLGEEYCDIVQISEKSQTYPGFLRRASLVFIHTLLPYIYARGFAELKKRARQHSLRHPRQPDDKKEMLLQKIQSWLPAIHEFIVKNVRPIHLAIFYFFGAYYSFSKRITGIRYIFTRQLGPHEERVGYEVLGVLICIQLAIQAFRAAHRYIENVRAASQAVKVQGEEEAKENAAKEQDDEYGFMDELLEKKAEDAEEEELTINEEDLTYEELQMLKCALCLEPRKRTTATQCGHLFCWDCIIEWCQNKPECPLCRSSVNISHLLPLNNF